MFGEYIQLLTESVDRERQYKELSKEQKSLKLRRADVQKNIVKTDLVYDAVKKKYIYQDVTKNMELKNELTEIQQLINKNAIQLRYLHNSNGKEKMKTYANRLGISDSTVDIYWYQESGDIPKIEARLQKLKNSRDDK